MKTLLLLAVLAAPSLLIAEETAELHPTSLLNWLRIVELEGNRLIYASETDKVFIAISRDQEGDLIVADYPKTQLPETAQRSITVTDPNTGESAVDDSKEKIRKVNTKTATVTYRSSSTARPLKTHRSISVSIDTGRVVPLRMNPPRLLRVQYFLNVADQQITLLDTQISLPSNDRTER